MKLKLEDEVKFGKHRGATFRELVNTDPQYLNWALENIDWLEVEDEIIDALDESSFRELLKCSMCKTPFKKIDEHTYEYGCDCPHGRKIRISVG